MMAQDARVRAFSTQFEAELAKLDGQFAAQGIEQSDHVEVRTQTLRKTNPAEQLTVQEWATLMETLASRLWKLNKWIKPTLVRAIFWYSAFFALLWLALFIVKIRYELQPQIPVEFPRTPQWNETIGLITRFNDLPRPCHLKISGPKSALPLREALIAINGATRNPTTCEIVDGDQDSRSEIFDVDQPQTPIANPGLTIRWKESNPAGQQFYQEMLSLGSLIIRKGHKIPTQYPSDIIWIEIGNGSPWKDQNPVGLPENGSSN